MRKHFLLYINNWTTNEISKNFLTVLHIVTIRNNGDTQKLDMLHSELQNLSEKHENIKSRYSIKQI